MHDADKFVFRLTQVSEAGLRRLAQELSLLLRAGDVVTLTGDLGAGKTTFARALIRALARDPEHEVPSPTFTLLQTYETDRLDIAHFDLYRLAVPEELDELGFEHVLRTGAAVVEWPERAADRLPGDLIDVALAESDLDMAMRDLVITGYGRCSEKVARLQAMHDLIRDAGLRRDDVCLTALAGDASTRNYARMARAPAAQDQCATLLLMDSPRLPDGPSIRDGKPYSQIAKLAEDVRPFVAIAAALKEAGLSAPEIHFADFASGFLILEDFGELDFKQALASGHNQAELWRDAVDALLVLRHLPADRQLNVSDDETHALPRLDETILEIETQLVPDWLFEAARGAPPDDAERAAYKAIWSPVFAEILSQPTGWMLRDFHSPNLILLSGRKGLSRVGIIDFQDALQGPLAYDLVSLLQDARLDVPAALEEELLSYYCDKAAAADPAFDEAVFRRTYALLGAQRNTKILGIFTRLARRDNKTRYLAHMPRIWGYLERNLAHPALSELAKWYDEYFPGEFRTRPVKS